MMLVFWKLLLSLGICKSWESKKIYSASTKYVQSKQKSAAHISQKYQSVTHHSNGNASSSLPEREDHEAGDDENRCKHSEDQVTRFPPACVVEHFGWLQWQKRERVLLCILKKENRVWHFHEFSSRGQTWVMCAVIWPLQVGDILFLIWKKKVSSTINTEV